MSKKPSKLKKSEFEDLEEEDEKEYKILKQKMKHRNKQIN